jgi:uncharacterized membrane protein YciS (DUF1049 family)
MSWNDKYIYTNLQSQNTYAYSTCNMLRYSNRGVQTSSNTAILDIAYFPSQVVYLLTIYSLLSVDRMATTISPYGNNNNFVLYLAYFAIQQTYSQNHIVVSSCNVGISITDIFASFLNVQCHVKSISLHRNDCFLHFIQ